MQAVGANGETPGTDKLDAGALRVNPAVKTITEALDDSVWIDQVKLAIEKANDNPKVCHNNAFKIQKFMILPTNFSEEQGFLTPTKNEETSGRKGIRKTDRDDVQFQGDLCPLPRVMPVSGLVFKCHEGIGRVQRELMHAFFFWVGVWVQ